ncbi:TPA: DUF3850 domain-containing protein [Clostridioides difficile]|uniref:DUF3850 domain-containing protein n=1 Tax=Clostridioides difficile TaxID=1496 RepID=UPI0002FA6DC7|nr:DUF3850 domain-containing protein [Clostridioides difficile]MBY1352525.1 DUF3850 domain-containing protein [Clostridioides difficile]MBY1961540.1 DUF3850 domain-containing protein [Clostridioides difficile]MCJ0276733.1 DUF3850 domain-containing protein [Clostridioides difficile]MCJ0339082.1 DUF3850 domain-containing protein [Clostridioides difficile]MDB3373209.1 DUF3850 domain-containing protein [Clostridioides difficile]
MIHELQISSSAFKDVIKNKKQIEVEYKANFKAGDTVIFQVFRDGKFTGIEANKEIEYFVKLGNGHVELGIK